MSSPPKERTFSEETSVYRGRVSMHIPTPVIPVQTLPRTRSMNSKSVEGQPTAPSPVGGRPLSRTGSGSRMKTPTADGGNGGAGSGGGSTRNVLHEGGREEAARAAEERSKQREKVRQLNLHLDHVVDPPVPLRRHRQSALWPPLCPPCLHQVLQILAQSTAIAIEATQLANLSAIAANGQATRAQFEALRVLPDTGFSVLPNLTSWGPGPLDKIVKAFLGVTLVRFLATPSRQTIFRHTYSHVVPLITVDVLAPIRCSRPFVSPDDRLIHLTFFKLLAWITAIVGYFLTIATHQHYTKLYHESVLYLTTSSRDTAIAYFLRWFEDYREEEEVHEEAGPYSELVV
ncbi:unnamed protein product [Sphagnum tenellum]